MTTKLRIEKIVPFKGHGVYIFVRPVVSGQKFQVTAKTFLNNVELEQYLDIPRNVKENGEPDFELYSLKLKNDHEAFRLKENTIVDLIPDKHPCLMPWDFANKELNSQLEREISPGHVLYGKDVKTIARRQDNDDVLFAVFDADFQYAKVHLTWSQSKVTDINYPLTKTYKDWQDVYDNLFLPDSKSWE